MRVFDFDFDFFLITVKIVSSAFNDHYRNAENLTSLWDFVQHFHEFITNHFITNRAFLVYL